MKTKRSKANNITAE